MYLVTKWFGTFLCNEKGIQEEILFPKNEKEIVKRLNQIEKKQILSEEKKISKNHEDVIVSEKRLEKIGIYKPDDSFLKDFEIKPEDFGYPADLLQKASIILAKMKTDEKLLSEDLQIVQMVNALDDLIQTSNLLSERLEAWRNLTKKSNKIKPLENAFASINNEIKTLENQIEKDMKNLAPNVSTIVGPLIGARLVSLSGSMEKLAIVPASTIQILGAEKALFRFKKEGGKPPKHGVIFQHKLINASPREFRGKMSRVLANKVSIAAKADFFTKRDISKELMKDLEERVKEIRNQ